MKLNVSTSGDTDSLERLLNAKITRGRLQLGVVGEEGVQALAKATPKDTGKTASSWYYTIEEEPGVITITWNNSNIVNHVPIAIILQYGHATRNGGWVEGTDYINPVTKEIFDQLAEQAWKVVTR